jgi:hypothetical protein
MKRADVIALLGPPLSEVDLSESGKMQANWTVSPTDSDYRRREIIFINDAVDEIVSEYWLD